MILVTGATGYIGSRLVKKLAEDGHAVRGMVIRDDPNLHLLDGVNCEIVVGDITNKETLGPCFEGVKTVFHLAAVLVAHERELFHRINYEGTKNCVDTAVEKGVKHFVQISAAAAKYRVRTTYGDSKLKCEALMKTRDNTQFTIIRPTLLYGDGGSQELKMYVERLKRFPLIVPVVGFGRTRKNPVWVWDIVKGLALLVDKPISYGKEYSFCGGTEVSMWEYTKLMCRTFGIQKPMVPIPVFLCDGIAWLCERFMKAPPVRKDYIIGVTMDAAESSRGAFEDIGYEPVDLYENYEKSFEEIPLLG